MQYNKCLILLLVLLSAKLFAQPVTPDKVELAGLWKGTLYNDSTQRYYRYEIGINEEKGKLSGFSHTFFMDGDKEFYGVKKVKVKRTDSKIIIEDAGLIANNYPVEPAKGVRQLNILTLEIRDSVMVLSGPFTTNRTKSFAPLTGTVTLKRKNDFWQSALVPHLQELGLADDLSFVKKEKELVAAAAKKTSMDEIAKNNTPVPKKENVPVAKKETVAGKDPVAAKENKTNKAPIREFPAKEPGKEVAKTEIPAKPVDVVPTIVPPAAEVNSRSTVLQQTVYFSSDSLLISLYDNGEVDGDTVSVLMNGRLIMAKEGLSTKAVQKTIYADKGADSIELVMYAENLGSIAPNTGLLVVHDGKSIYEIRFSGDLKKNASIILRRRKIE